MNLISRNWIALSSLILILIWVNGLMATPLSGTYTVGGTGADFNTLGIALGTLNAEGQSAEVTFTLNAGTYNGPFVINRPSSAHHFILRTEESTEAILDNPASSSTENYVLKIDNDSNITISNLKFVPTGSYPNAIVVLGNSDNLTFYRNRFQWPASTYASNSYGISFSPDGANDPDNISFIQNSFFNGYWHIYSSTYSSLSNSNNWLFSINGHYGGYGAVYLKQTSDLRIYGGEVENTNSGYTLESCTGDLEVNENKINSYQLGLSLSGCDFISQSTSRIYNNLISVDGTGWYNPNYDVDAVAISIANCIDLSILHNSVLNSSQTIGSAALSLTGTNLLAAKNNLCAMGMGIALYAYNSSNPVEYNNLFAAHTNLARIGNNYYHTFSELLEDFDYPNCNVAPFYTPNLQTPSPQLDSYGPAYGILIDYNGHPRSTENPSIGAHEYSADPSLLPLSGTINVGSGQAYSNLSSLFNALSLRGISGNLSINLVDSLYTDSPVLVGIPGAENYTISIQPASLPIAVIRYSGQSADANYLMQIMRASNISFYNLHFQTINPTYSNLIDLYGFNSNVRFFNCSFTSSQNSTGTSIGAAYNSLADGIEILACDFYQNQNGIYLYGNNATIGSSYFSGQQIGIALTQSNSSEISGNRFEGLHSACIQINGGKALQIIRNSGEGIATGIYLSNLEPDGTTRNLIANNAFKIGDANMRYGISLGGSGINVINNTFQTLGTHSFALYCYQLGSQVDIVNNIFVARQAHAVEFSYFTPSADKVIDYNCYYTPTNLIARFAGYYNSLAALQAAYPDYNQHSVFINPLLTADLHTTSPWLRRIGIFRSEISLDMDNEPRGELFDMGADQQTGAYGFTPLSGTYNIGNGGGYPTLQAFLSDLMMYGSFGQVTARLLSGVHNAMNTISFFPRVVADSPLNIIALPGATFTLNPDQTGALNNYLFRLEGADHVFFSGLDIDLSHPSCQSTAFILEGKCDDISFTDCSFNLGTAYNTGIYTTNSISDGLNINSCSFTGGQRALNLSGSGYDSDLYENIRIENCSFSGTPYPLEISKANNFKLISSQFTTFTTALGLSYTYGNTDIVRNRFISHDYLGAYSASSMLSLSNVIGTADQEIEILNNVIYSTNNQVQSLTGLVLGNCAYLRAYHNSISIANNYSFDYSNALNATNSQHVIFVNNIFSCQYSGHALALANVTDTWFANNNYYSSGINLLKIDNIAYPVETAFTALPDANAFYANPLTNQQGNTMAAYLGNKGAPSYVQSDIDYVVYGSTIPIGANDIVFAEALSGTYTVGTGGAFSSMGEALDTLVSRGISAALTLNLLPGNHPVSYILNYVPQSLNYPLNITGTNATLISTANSEATNYIFKAMGVRNLQINGLSFQAPDPALSRCLVFDSFNKGISIADCSFTTPVNSITGYNSAAIYLDNKLMQDLHLEGNSIANFAYGIYYSGDSQTLQLNTGLELYGNSFGNNYTAIHAINSNGASICDNTISSYRSYGIYLNSPSGNMEIMRNSISGNGNSALQYSNYSGSGASLLIANNYLKNSSTSSGSTLYLQNCSPRLYFNSILRSASTYDASALYLDCAISSGEIVNNIFSSTSGFAAFLGALGSLSRVDHNLFYRSGSAPLSVNGSPIANLSQWTALTGDSTCLFADPWLAENSYELLASSPAINAGIAIDGYAYDILGRLRNLPDMGCREYDGSTLISPSGLNIVYDEATQEIVLTWNAVGGASSYKIYSADDPDATLWTSQNVSVNSIRIPISAARKFYKVSAVN